MYVQYTVYQQDENMAFVHQHQATRYPSIGETVKFQDDHRYAKVIDIVFHVHDDSEPLIEVVCRVCDEPKCI
jgi:hypothetical protein